VVGRVHASAPEVVMREATTIARGAGGGNGGSLAGQEGPGAD
jgi:hypothetical protein